MTGDDGRLIVRNNVLENLLLTSLSPCLCVAVGLQSFLNLVDFDLLLKGDLKDVILTLAENICELGDRALDHLVIVVSAPEIPVEQLIRNGVLFTIGTLELVATNRLPIINC